jgi:hypothetical protein
MDKIELAKLITEVISGSDVHSKGSAVCQIVATKDLSAVRQMLSQMQQISSNEFDGRVLDTAVDLFIDNISTFLPLLVEYTEKIPDTLVGRNIIYMLGEISYKQCLYKKVQIPEPKILVALVGLLQQKEARESYTISTAVSSIKSYSYYGDPTLAQTDLELLIASCKDSLVPPKYFYPCISEAIDILARIHQSDKLTELQSQSQRANSASWLASQIQEEIQELTRI